MKPFLHKLAGQVASRYGDDPSQVCIVLPNRRAGLYLKKYLAENLQKVTWSPATYSIEDFITLLSGVQIIDPTNLLFEFYQVHREIHGSQAQDFDAFADWAPVLLQDFDEIDQYLADPHKVFTYLSEARALSVWNLDEKPLTDQEKSYLAFYNSFLTYYQQLHKRLIDKKKVYQGLAYRLAAENIGGNDVRQGWKRIFFAGLNALSAAEEKVINHFISKDMAEIFWDADEYYIRDDRQEAGRFIRYYLEKWPKGNRVGIENNLLTEKKFISVMGVTGSMGQAEKAGEIMLRLKPEGTSAPDRTALVLADEKLLLPVLYSLPEKLGAVNVTMGYPFRYTHLYQLTMQLFKMHENAEKFTLQRKSHSRSLYVKDILGLLAHPMIALFGDRVEKGQFSPERIGEILRNKNRVFISPEEIIRFAGGIENNYFSLLHFLFNNWEKSEQALINLLKIIEMIRDRIIPATGDLSPQEKVDLEYLFHLSRIIRKIRTLMDGFPFMNSLKTLRKILAQQLDNYRLPFSGEPLNGIQVMGVLETRALDFENLVMLSVNEGILPSGRVPNSFLPFDIKTEFGLPTFRHKDAVFAYHFYHALQRARNIFLIYDTEGDQMKGGEKSRFITQIGYELVRKNPLIEFTETILRPRPPKAALDKGIVMAKTPEVMNRLKKKCRQGFSPTALNLYIRCPLKFYFQEILGLTEAETVEETIEAKTMGTAIHQVLQKIYEPFAGFETNGEALAARLAQTEQLMQEAFLEHYREGDLDHGKNHLVYKVSLFLARQFIRQEAELLKKENMPLKIISLEQGYEARVNCRIEDEITEVGIKGKIDRIDRWGDITRIIDYKTGIVQARELAVKDWNAITTDPEMGKAFQLLLYAWLYSKVNPGEKIQTGNISLRKISAGFIMVRLPGDEEFGEEALRIFEEKLTGLIEEILDAGKSFEQTRDIKNCQYCPFREICTRQ